MLVCKVENLFGENAYRCGRMAKHVIVDKWHLMIAHPPCTYLTSSGAKWYYHPEDKHLPIEDRRPHPKFPNRKQDQEDGANFFMAMMDANIDYIAVENPVGVMSTRYRKPDQIVQPFMFGDQARKNNVFVAQRVTPFATNECSR